MKILLIISFVVLSLSGCYTPSGIADLGCGPFGCRAKDYYLPGKGVWAPEPLSLCEIKSRLGISTGCWEFDKASQIHGAKLWQKVLDKNSDGIPSSWRHPFKSVTVSAYAGPTNGNCRVLTTKVISAGKKKILGGNACKINGEWEIKEMTPTTWYYD